MNGISHQPALVLAIAGHDPSGGAGIQADIESITQCGARCATLITATTAQNSGEFAALYPQPLAQFREAARLLLSDMTFSACKVGLLGSAEIGAYTASLLKTTSPGPLVLDPILHSGTGTAVADPVLLQVIRKELCPLATLLTPNIAEALQLAGCGDAEEAGRRLLDLGAANVLITGGDAPTPTVVNRLYLGNGSVITHEFPRLPFRYHGSGCTLSSAIAALLARGLELETAVEQALAFTRDALQAARQLGKGQRHPDRMMPARPPGN